MSQLQKANGSKSSMQNIKPKFERNKNIKVNKEQIYKDEAQEGYAQLYSSYLK